MDPYVYPGTNVLRNLRDIRDQDRLTQLEADVTSRRVRQLSAKSKPGALDSAHVQSIHRYIFQDVYEWAGEFRTVNIARPGQFYFAFAEQIVPALGNTLAQLQQERWLAGLDAPGFAGRAAHYMGELNAIHPFRDGNGRTQREFIRQLALRNGFALSWSRISRDQMYEASQRSFARADNAGLAQVIQAALGSGTV